MEPVETPITLLEKLRLPTPPPESWQRFTELFTPFLYDCVRRLAVPEEEVAEVVQEVFLVLLRGLGRCGYDRQRGRFRNWLRAVTLNKWREMQRRELRRRQHEITGQDLEQLHEATAVHQNNDFWDEVYPRQVIQQALLLVQNKVSTKIWRAFEENTLRGRPTDEVAAELDTTPNAIWIARCRVLKHLRDLLDGFLD
jgi:RNA polymerase sigma-70 factor (ECF subfamily)